MPREMTVVIDNKGKVLSETISETDLHPNYSLMGTVIANIYREQTKEDDKASA